MWAATSSRDTARLYRDRQAGMRIEPYMACNTSILVSNSIRSGHVMMSLADSITRPRDRRYILLPYPPSLMPATCGMQDVSMATCIRRSRDVIRSARELLVVQW